MFSSSDTDECAEGTDDCDQICINTVGSFECACEDGFVLDNDGRTCNGTNTLPCTYIFFTVEWHGPADNLGIKVSKALGFMKASLKLLGF